VYFSGNSAGEGGGMYNRYSFPNITGCSFFDNSSEDGGGMLNKFSNPTVKVCTFSGNSASNSGGGMNNNSNSSPNLINCKFSGNSAEFGGGINNNSNSSPNLINCSFSGNSANQGGGLYNISLASPSVKNCILWGNSSGIVNNVGCNPTVTNSIVQGGYSPCTDCPGGNGNVDPLFVNATDLHLQGCSPAIDAGTSSGAPATDLDGNARPHDAAPNVPGNFDMGAYEFQSQTTAPVAACQNITVQLTADHTVSVSGSQVNDGSTGCGALSFLLNGQTSLTFDCDDVGAPQNVTLTLTDYFANTATCAATITVADDDNPCCAPANAVCQNATIYLDENGEATLLVSDVDGGSTYECGLDEMTLSAIAFGCDVVAATQSVTLTVTDANGDSDQCTADVTVVDDLDPQATAGSIEPCYPTVQAAEAAALAATSATDNCGITLSASTTGACNAQVTVTATDPSGNTDVVVYQTNIGLTEPVLANLPTGGDLGCNPDLPACDGNVSASNECGSVPVTCSAGSISQNGCNHSQTFTYTATDECSGLSTSADVTYTWQEVTAPVLANLPAGGNLGCNPTPPSCDANVSASNECGSVDVTCSAGSISQNGCDRSQTFTYSATDACSGLSTSADVTYTWQEVTAPVLANLPTGSYLGCNPDLPACDVNVSASNECGSVDLTCSAGSISQNGSDRSKTISSEATDACSGLSTSVEVTYTWQVLTAVTISNCPGDITVFSNDGNPLSCAQTATWTAPTAANDCGTALLPSSQSHFPGAAFNLGATGVSYAFTDAANNTAACSFMVTVIDDTPPSVACKPHTISLDASGQAAIAPDDVLDAGGDNCGTVNLESVYPDVFDCSSVGENTVLLTVNDGHGNTNTCTATVTVTLDNTAVIAYTLLAQEEVHTHRTTVNGNVGVWQAGKQAKIHDYSAVSGFVKAPVIDLDNNATIGDGQLLAQAPQPGAFRYNTQADPSSDINVPDNYSGVYQLTGTLFRKIEVGKNSTVRFMASGDIFIKEFKTKDSDNGNHSSVLFSGNTELIIRKKLELGKRTEFNWGGSNSVKAYVEEDEVKVKESSKVNASLDVRFQQLTVEDAKETDHTMMTGQFIAKKIDAQKWVDWNWAPFGCGQIPPSSNLLVSGDILGLDATLQGEQVQLLWLSNTGFKTGSFEVERSSDGISFEPLTEVVNNYIGDAAKQYRNDDPSPLYGPNFYRVKVRYEDGTWAYTNISRVDYYFEPGELTLWPNPASTSVSLFNDQYAGKPAKVVISNNLGQPVLKQEFEALPDGPVSFDLGSLKDGMYWLNVKVEGKRARSVKFVVANGYGTRGMD
jgi:hypothetical protein